MHTGASTPILGRYTTTTKSNNLPTKFQIRPKIFPCKKLILSTRPLKLMMHFFKQHVKSRKRTVYRCYILL